MPTYEYQCTECNSVFDVFQSIKASPLRSAECAKCGGKRKVRRLIGTGGAVIFKGGGFYQTDYRSESYKKAAKSESGEKSGDASSAKTSADSKSPGAKGDTKAAPAKSSGSETSGKKSGKSD